jgi:hypothetical protein
MLALRRAGLNEEVSKVNNTGSIYLVIDWIQYPDVQCTHIDTRSRYTATQKKKTLPVFLEVVIILMYLKKLQRD